MQCLYKPRNRTIRPTQPKHAHHHANAMSTLPEPNFGIELMYTTAKTILDIEIENKMFYTLDMFNLGSDFVQWTKMNYLNDPVNRPVGTAEITYADMMSVGGIDAFQPSLTYTNPYPSMQLSKEQSMYNFLEIELFPRGHRFWLLVAIFAYHRSTSPSRLPNDAGREDRDSELTASNMDMTVECEDLQDDFWIKHAQADFCF